MNKDKPLLVSSAPEVLKQSDIAEAAMTIAADLCIYTNTHTTFEELNTP